MSPDERAKLLGGELTKATDELVASFRMSEAQHVALGNFLAAVIGRVTEKAASRVIEAHNLVERVEGLETREAGRG